MLPSYSPQSMQAAGHECKQARSCTQANRPGRATRVARSRRSATGREVAFAFVFALFAFQNSPKNRYSSMSLNILWAHGPSMTSILSLVTSPHACSPLPHGGRVCSAYAVGPYTRLSRGSFASLALPWRLRRRQGQPPRPPPYP